MPLEYNPKNLSLARGMRKNATPQENRLWYDFLRSYDVRFRRQQPIDNYIADFFCYRAKLVIEVDGSQHYSEKGKQNDAFRTEELEGYGLKIIRFTNRQIDTNFGGVWQVHRSDGQGADRSRNAATVTETAPEQSGAVFVPWDKVDISFFA